MERGFDEEQVLRREVPFLEPDPPAELDNLTAAELCEREKTFKLELEMAATAVRDVLQEYDKSVPAFPVLGADKTCIGFTTRERLKNAFESAVKAYSQDVHEPNDHDQEMDRLVSDPQNYEDIKLPTTARLSVGKLVDCAPYTVLAAMPAPRVYALFAKAGVTITCVVNSEGQFVGMITRGGLIKFSRELDSG